MESKYKIDNPAIIRIDGLQSIDIKGLHTILKNEGCIDSENLFTDNEKAIALDDIQTRLSKRNHSDKKASADILICIVKNKYILADAKFRQKNVKNLSSNDLRQKLDCSKSLVKTDEMAFGNAFFVLFQKNILTGTAKRWLKQQFKNSPLYRFENAIEFHNYFEN
ncbi:MAG: hypothetical protein II956_12910 [Bacteroidales bacterium]|nr:hypothetical protein [Bacteroidales bacterium]